jgi:DNA-binding MarR family transcriptional regulator
MKLVFPAHEAQPDRPEATADLAQVVGHIARSLQGLQEELQRATAVTLEGRASVDVGRSIRGPGHPGGSMEVVNDLQMDVRRARKLRMLRKQIFGAENYSGPAWDILLYLFESYVSQRTDTIGNVCDGAAIPGATTLRWITRLEQQNLVEVEDDHLDRRRRFVELSQTGIALMTKYFSGTAPHSIAA